MLPAPRIRYLGAALCCAGLLAFGYYLQYFQNVEPCPLCILQRVVFFSVILLCLVRSACHLKTVCAARVYASLLFLLSSSGIALACRHLWIIHHPQLTEGFGCGPDITYLLRTLPWQMAIHLIFSGTASCAKVTWTFLTITIPGWSLVCFSLLALFALFQLVRGE
jgi:disulfide bond formation protein DsbB